MAAGTATLLVSRATTAARATARASTTTAATADPSTGWGVFGRPTPSNLSDEALS